MYKHGNLLLKICVSSLVFTASVVATNSASISAKEAQPSTIKYAQVYACAGKNPCASKHKSVGGPLAKELQGKPAVVDVFATWCGGCQNVAPTLSKLKQKYSEKVNFIVLDVTDRGTLKNTKAEAEKLGLGKFLADNKSKTSTVAIVDPATGDILAMYYNNANEADYTKVLESFLAKN